MKITRLSSTEVANVSVLPYDKKYAALVGIERGHSWGYQPVHDALPMLLLAGGTLFPHLPPDNDEALINHIVKACKRGADQQAANESVARAILGWRKKSGASGRVVSPEPLRMSVDTLKYCADVAVVVDGVLYIISLDCRSSLTLKSTGREFMKSLIHHTARIGDLRDASVAILRTPKGSGGQRAAQFEVLAGEPVYSLDQVLQMVTETYTIWETILRARQSGKGGAGTGSA